MKESKAYPYLKALLEGLIEAAPNWMKAPAKFVSSLSEQLKDKGKEENKQLEKEIKSISEGELRKLIKETGSEQKANLELIVKNIEPIIVSIKALPEILPILDYRFDKVDEAHEIIIKLLNKLLLQERPSLKFPFDPSLHNQTAPEENFVGRKDMLDTITQWYKNPDVRIGGLIGWGGVGKSALVRKWYDKLGANNIQPDGIFWWGFYRNAYLEQFLNALLRYVSGGRIEPDNIKSTWEKVERIKEYIHQGRYLIVLDGLEQMQKGESGDEFGKMVNRELTELLHYLADGPKTEGLCLITTRYTMKDLDGWENQGYENLELTKLDEQDALLMLKNRGVVGDDEKIKELIKRYKGHALSLTLLAGYLKKYHKGDIEQAPDVEFILGDRERFEDVNKLMRRYAEKMTKAERVFLNIFSLFRQDVTERDFGGVFRHKIKGTRLNKALVKMNKLDFKDMVVGLVDWRLIAHDETKDTYSTHPLIKGYFESDFNENDKKLCHKRVYQYFGEDAPERPETLDEMQPLFEQVYHGCAAGLYDEVNANVRREKIWRGQEKFIIHKLGAWESALSIVKTFFPEGDLSQMPLVSEKSWLLNEAGVVLLATGRPKEAEAPLKASIKLYIQNNEIAYASVGYHNLADLQFLTGEMESGLESAQKALKMSEKGRYDFGIWNVKSLIAWISYLLGKNKEADNDFKRADELSIKKTGNHLYSGSGIHYADFLVSMKKIDEAFRIISQNLEFCRKINIVNFISQCQRCLGAIERVKGNYKEAEDHLQDALKGANKVGQPFLEIEVLLESGKLYLETERYEEALSKAREVLKLCGRTGFKFYEPGAEIVLGKAYLGIKDFEQAEANAHSAYEKAVGMKYRWAEGDAADLLGEIYSVRGDKAKGRKWLKKAVGCRKEILDPKVKESEGKLAGSE